MAKNRDYSVGYGRPPAATRFKPGQSGNPNGRPKGAKNIETDLSEELGQKIKVREGEQTIRISKQRAMIKALMAKALRGDSRAIALLLNLTFKTQDTTPEEKVLTPNDEAILDEYVRQFMTSQESEMTNSEKVEATADRDGE
jgi:hypothetical protein